MPHPKTTFEVLFTDLFIKEVDESVVPKPPLSAKKNRIKLWIPKLRTRLQDFLGMSEPHDKHRLEMVSFLFNPETVEPERSDRPVNSFSPPSSR